MSPFRLLGALLAIVGLVLAFDPSLVADQGPAADTFEAIERRIRWGGVVGLGLLLLVHTKLRPWSQTIAAAILWGMVGFLSARCIGLALDGYDSTLQWVWVGVEVAIGLAAGVGLHWLRSRARRSDPSA